IPERQVLRIFHMEDVLSRCSVAGDGEALIDRGDAGGMSVNSTGSRRVMQQAIPGNSAMEAAGKHALSGEIHSRTYVDGGRPGCVCGVAGASGEDDCAHVIPATERKFRGAAIDLHSDIGARTLVGEKHEPQRAWCKRSPVRLSNRLISGGSG